MSRLSEHNFIVTCEYRRFTEFCDACQRYRYIGLCVGSPGVGKTLSARHYANWDKVESCTTYEAPTGVPLEEVLGSQVLFYTPRVVNAPKQIDHDIAGLRRHLHRFPMRVIDREEAVKQEERRQQEHEHLEKLMWEHDWFSREPLPIGPGPSRREIAELFDRKRSAVADPTRLIIVDEADRLKMAGLEQMRAIFDQGGVGLILIGMPGLEKRLGRYPQLYSRVGFVHEFRALNAEEVREFLLQSWTPPQTTLPAHSLTDDEALATIIRITGGNFRLLHRLLTQIARLMEINALQTVTRPVVEAARETLVIGIT